MFVWNIEATAKSSTTPERLWKCWKEVARWPSWNSDIETVTLLGPFVQSATGLISFSRLHNMPFSISYLDSKRGFSIVAKRFFTTIAFIYHYEVQKDKSMHITHKVIVGGLLAPFLRFTWGKRLQKTLPGTLLKQIQIAEGRER